MGIVDRAKDSLTGTDVDRETGQAEAEQIEGLAGPAAETHRDDSNAELSEGIGNAATQGLSPTHTDDSGPAGRP